MPCAGLLIACVLAAGCKREANDKPAPKTKSGESVILRGSFQAVTKPASGTAEIVRQGEAYVLKLTKVTVQSKANLHVYLVGLPSATTTLAVDEVEMKYDMAEFNPSLPEQLIDLPSEPDPALRSVVLWDPKYSANLAAASLSPP